MRLNDNSTTQQHLNIDDVKNDLLILKNGNIVLLLETSGINFELLANTEQDIKIRSFAGLLNSLNFILQIVILTRKIDMSNYIKLLLDEKKEKQNNSIKHQMDVYIDFINKITKTKTVLEKRFIVAIPYYANFISTENISKNIFKKKEKKITINDKLITKALNDLTPKKTHLIKQFAKIGINAKQLRNIEIVKLFYSVYNTFEIEEIKKNL